jgi:hypothetical protein
VIVHINHIAPGRKKAGQSPVSQLAGLVNGAMLSMVDDDVLDARRAPPLRVHLDWIQYKTNFRDPVMVRRTADSRWRALALAEIARAVRSLADPFEANPHHHVFLGGFTPYRGCLIWDAASGKGFEAAHPAGSSDANHPDAVAASARELLSRVQALDAKGRTPAEIIGLEIGVGTGARAASWLDRFKAYDAEAGGRFYPRLQFLLADYSPTSLDRAMAAVAHHAGHVTAVPLDALNPVAALGAHRFKVLYVHSTNTYDNLPFDDLVRRDGTLYLVETRAYLNGAAVNGLVADFGFTRGRLSQGLSRPRETRRVARHVGERRAAARGRRARRLRRPLRTVPVSPRDHDHDSVHHPTRVSVSTSELGER